MVLTFAFMAVLCFFGSFVVEFLGSTRSEKILLGVVLGVMVPTTVGVLIVDGVIGCILAGIIVVMEYLAFRVIEKKLTE